MRALDEMLWGILTAGDPVADEPEDDDEGVDCD